MTIQQLRYFLALCQDLNYTRTAGRLYLSRQALRLSIAALENELCGPLFINVRNHLALTEKGQRFRAQAAPVVEQFDRMCAQAYQDIRSPALRLGISVALVPSYLPMLGDVLEQFRQQYPGIPLETASFSNDAVCAQLQNGTLDAGLESIAFCCISTGVFCFPNEDAAEIAVQTVKEFLQTPTTIKKVIFNVFKDLDKEIYTRLLTA